MRKLKLQVQMSIDGFIAGPNGEMDWLVWNWDDELKQYVNALHEPVDCILLGRVLAQGFIHHWANRVEQGSGNEDYEFACKMTDTPKVVFSKTLENNEWDNTMLATGDVVEEITRLKAQEGGDIITYGGARFASSLIRNGLIDEYHLFVNPTAIGNGMAIFNNLEEKLNMQLVHSQAFSCGIVVLCYQPRAKETT